MAIFNKFYATYYDFLYKGKNYLAEADFFDSLIKRFGLKNSKSILSFGAGTLNHEKFLVKKGYHIHGVEISAEMVKLGKEKIIKNRLKNVSLVRGDMRKYNSKEKYDVVLVMFNSVAYCQGLNDIEKFIGCASNALNTGGVLIFDCWNAKVAQNDPPQNTWAKIKIGKKALYKMVESSPMNKDNSFNRKAELMVVEGNKIIGKQGENHKLYTWNIDEVNKIASKYSLELLMVSDFMKINDINNTRWTMVPIFRKK